MKNVHATHTRTTCCSRGIVLFVGVASQKHLRDAIKWLCFATEECVNELVARRMTHPTNHSTYDNNWPLAMETTREYKYYYSSKHTLAQIRRT
jgi:hypothetical protein